MLTQDYLKSIFEYNSETGIFTRKISKGNCKAGSIANSKNHKNYIVIKINNKNYLGHRLAWLYIHGYMPILIDHINCNPSDNRLCNLREATLNQNQHNRKVNKNSKSQHKNIFFNKKRNKFQVIIQVNGVQKMIGRYESLDEAIIAAQNARIEYHGDFYNNGN